ncbi:glycosyltransferase family 2 protein [Citreimonas salinaria]|uniref:Glycosyl transferase family 2 n=1 Tax=Citreimonas salinaria TaxID=321339 RepID=A0A1H3GAJ6_9RHOB|nr:glycosyltransferase family 2 protein [Citreimonas salinaria]SDY00362.1 Glycosyl transferase family 2 [Citreimonas salinaria]
MSIERAAPRVTAVTCMKNEGPFILEWVAHHRVLGVTDFLVYSNDCDDGTDLLLDALAAQGWLVHLPNPAQGRNYQMEALRDAARQPVVTRADWVWVADVDEFLNVHAGDHSIAALVAACRDPQAISIPFQFFANGGVVGFEDRPVTEQFDRCHNPDIWCDQTAIEVKTLVRADFPLQYFGAHRPYFRKGQGAPSGWTDASGRAVPTAFRDGSDKRLARKLPARGARRFATLNHYPLRSAESFLVKIARGDVNRAGRAFDEGYWRDRNDEAWADRSILRHRAATAAMVDDLRRDAAVARAHAACVAAHRDRIAALLADPDTAAFARNLATLPTIPEAEAALAAELGLG